VPSPGSGACEAVAEAVVAVLPALAGSGLLTVGAMVLMAAVGTATLGVAIALAGEIAADEAGAGAVVAAGVVVVSGLAVVVAVESEATCVVGAGAGTGRGTAGVAGFAELDDEAGCIPANTNTRSICG
jgi:hypothetical protein